jgi:hypothetical protein
MSISSELRELRLQQQAIEARIAMLEAIRTRALSKPLTSQDIAERIAPARLTWRKRDSKALV